MEKKLKIAFGMVSLSLVAIVAFQLYWTINAFHVNKKTFDNKIDIAMQQALDSCKKYYFDSVRVVLVKRLSDTSEMKIKIDTTLSYTDDKGPHYAYKIYLNSPKGDQLGFLVPKRPSPVSSFVGPGPHGKMVPITGAPQFLVDSTGKLKKLTPRESIAEFKKTVSTMVIAPLPKNPGKSTVQIIPNGPITFEPTLTIDNKHWDFYKHMIKHKATVPEVIAEMSFYVPLTMQNLWWAFTNADMREPVNKTSLKETMAKYKGAARDSFFAHGGAMKRIGIGVIPPNYIKIEQHRIQQYFNSALAKQNIDAPYYLNLSDRLAPVADSARTSKTTAQEYKYYGMRIFGLSANMPALFVEAVFTDSKYAVLKAMGFTLIASVLLIILTAAAFTYTIRIILHQKKLAELKDDFINNMTHELKTPIATITVAIEGLQKFNALTDPEKTQRYLQTSRVELTRLNDLVTKVLNIATFENKEIEMVKTQIDIDELLQDVIQSEKAKTGKAVDFTYQNNDAVKYLYADKLHFRNIMTNLIDNAVKYSGDAVEIIINVNSDNHYIYLSVKDNGIGIAQGDIAQVFDKFYRVPTGNVHNVKGTGLGLSYVKYIAESHGGRVEVKSEANAGTEFIVSLPLIDG